MRTRPVASWLVLALPLLLCLPAALGLEKIACPESIEVSEPQLVAPVRGWTAMDEKMKHQLSDISFYDGPVSENASLAPDGGTKTQKTRTELWQLDSKSVRGYWLACRYSGTTLALTRPLPKGLTQCAVVYNNQESIEGMPVVENISCK
jgi:hypothetical protein